MRSFSFDSLPSVTPSNYERKIAVIKAWRVEGPFTVETTEGEMRCEDGYLALDTIGNPYPISKEAFEQTYSYLGESEEWPNGRNSSMVR